MRPVPSTELAGAASLRGAADADDDTPDNAAPLDAVMKEMLAEKDILSVQAVQL